MLCLVIRPVFTSNEFDLMLIVFSRLTAQEFDPAEFPASYKDNLPKENLVLQYAENFRLQYVHLYRDRKPLLLNPINECGTEVIGIQL